MWAAVKAFVSGNIAKLLEILGIVGAAIAAVTGIYEAGKKAEKADESNSVLKDEGEAHAIEDKNRATLRDGDAAGKLQSDWSR